MRNHLTRLEHYWSSLSQLSLTSCSVLTKVFINIHMQMVYSFGSYHTNNEASNQ